MTLLGAILILVGAFFTLVGAVGLFRFRTLYARMHAATKPQMLGLLCLLSGLALTIRTWQAVLGCVLILAIQMVAAPVASHLMGRSAYRQGLADGPELVVDELAADTDD
ncbi:monovalent cation/H(+) antiporter subunit G [Scrofimicrobium sp. R131]|uniref:Monovalent cation/H(+) antiporter subunit G n=1 Tax=Scrofimicrobium appendicitidis TaxID=3079930 RepID=A0AAU7V9V8_9ACTO